MTERGDEPEERRLIEAAQKDPRRFVDLYEIHFDLVYAYVVRRVRNRDEAQDLTADVFYRVLAKLDRFEWRGAPFAAWLLRIAAHAVAERGRRSARQGTKSLVEDVEHVRDAVVPGLEEVEEHARLFRLVQELPPDQGQVIHQRFVERRSIREIAQGLGRSEGAVKQLQFRALKNLRARMRDSNG